MVVPILPGTEGRGTFASLISTRAARIRLNIQHLTIPITSHRRDILKPVGAWRSPVAHLYGVQEVAGSNPAAPTTLL